MRWRLVIVFLLTVRMLAAEVNYSPEMLPLIMNDIYEQLVEAGREPDAEELHTELTYLHENPINLNTATEDDLRRLRFLNSEQIDAILLMVYRQPLQNLYELRLIGCLADYEIRNMLPFVYVAEVEKTEPFYWKEMFHKGRHELNLRFDARSIEDNGNDPFYASFKYRFTYMRKVDVGIVMERDPKEPFYSKGKTYGADFYGGWLQVSDVWRFKRIVLGDYRASFGQGLVLNTGMSYGGKAEFLLDRGFRDGGLIRKTSGAEYGFLRGTGATLGLGKVDISVLYSARKLDGRLTEGVFPTVLQSGYHRTETEIDGKRAVWQQVVGMNVSLRLKRFRLGLTATENLLGDTLRPKANYYNSAFFQGKRQFAAGVNYEWRFRRFCLLGEVATAENTKWGMANITGLRFRPVNGVTLSAVYRYYSHYYDNMLANALSESSRLNDEQAAYLGFDVMSVAKWRFSGYADLFFFRYPKYQIHEPSYGVDAYFSAGFQPRETLGMQWSLKGKYKGGKQKYSLRYTLSATAGNWHFRTCAEGNLAKKQDSVPTLGGLLWQQVEYHASKVPIVVQARAEGFYTATYDNRFFSYENDVLYAFSVPQIYGLGARWFLNFRYSINEHLALYLKASQTIFSDQTMAARSLTSRTRSEVHTMLRVKF